MGAAASFTKDRLTADEARQLAGDDWNPELFDQLKGDDGCVSMDQLRAVKATMGTLSIEQRGNIALRESVRIVLLVMRQAWVKAGYEKLPDFGTGLDLALLLFEGRFVWCLDWCDHCHLMLTLEVTYSSLTYICTA